MAQRALGVKLEHHPARMVAVLIFARYERRTGAGRESPRKLRSVAEAGDDFVCAGHVVLPENDIEIFKLAKRDVLVRLHGSDRALVRYGRNPGLPKAAHNVDELSGENQAARRVRANCIHETLQLLRRNDFGGAGRKMARQKRPKRVVRGLGKKIVPFKRPSCQFANLLRECWRELCPCTAEEQAFFRADFLVDGTNHSRECENSTTHRLDDSRILALRGSLSPQHISQEFARREGAQERTAKRPCCSTTALPC